MMKRTGLALLAAFFLSASSTLALTHMDDGELLAGADLVAVGDAVSVQQGLESTQTQVRLAQVLKGAARPGELINIESQSGKVIIDESQPTFAALQLNLLFLQKTPTGYSCLNGADGQKVIRGKNIYPYHDNVSYSVPLETYLKTLEASAKAKRLSL